MEEDEADADPAEVRHELACVRSCGSSANGRVSNVLRSWLDVHFLEAEDAVVLDPIENFASTTMAAEGSELLSRQLVALVQRRVGSR